MGNSDLNLSGLAKKGALSESADISRLSDHGMAFARAALILEGFVSNVGLIGKGIVSVALFLTPDKAAPTFFCGLATSVVCFFS